MKGMRIEIVSWFLVLGSFRVKDGSGNPFAEFTQQKIVANSLTADDIVVLEWDVDPPARPNN